jgi:outer membrane protein OmpA-like peptidoglycan-associated protein
MSSRRLAVHEDDTYCVVGYADAVGELEKNDDLSHRRAENMKAILAKLYPRSAFLVGWRGSSQSHSNDGADRKVEIRRVLFQ